MSEARWSVSLAILISVLITFSSLEVDAQPTVDDGTSYESSTSDEAVNFIKKELKNVRLIRKDLEDVKNVLGSIQHCATTTISNSDRISALTYNCVPLLIQQNVDGAGFFNRSWADFKVGFNDTGGKGNYWLGNDLLHQLTRNSGRNYKLRFDLHASNDSWYYAEYDSFVVFNEETNYRITVSDYRGNAGNSFGHLNTGVFSTYDRDNDQDETVHAALGYGGGFWFERTYCKAGVNSIGRMFRWSSTDGGVFPLHLSRMWLVC